MEPGLTIGEEQGWSEGRMSLAVELISRHDPTIKAVERNMDMLRSEIAQGLAEHEPEKFTGTEGRRRLVEDILRLANSTLLAEGESARVEAVRFPAKQVKVNGRSSSNQDLTADL
jgi:flagellar basal body-associated protein FliL